MRKHWLRLLIGIACVGLLAGHALRVWQMPFLTQMDAYLYDVRVRHFMPDTVNDRVVIVDLDEKSLAEVGRWPWSRNVVAELVRKLVDDYQVAVVGFDVVFAEPDESSGLRVLEKLGQGALKHEPAYQSALRQLRPELDYDRLFAETLRNRPAVLGYYFLDGRSDGALPPPTWPAGKLDGLPNGFVRYSGYGANLPVLQQTATAAGHFNPVTDSDGVVRRVPLLIEYQGAYYETLSLAMLRVLFEKPELLPVFPDPTVPMEFVDLDTPFGTIRLPVDQNACALVPYRGRERSFPYFSAVDVLQGRIAPEDLMGRVVLVGTTAQGLRDLRSTPVGAAYPGVEVHANLISSMLGGLPFKHKPADVLTMDLLQVTVYGLLIALILPFLSPLRATLLTAVVAGVSIGINFYLWEAADLVLPMAANLLGIVLLYAMNTAWGFFAEARTKQQFTELFGQYVPPELVDEMARSPENYSMEGRNQELSILFSDVRSFTTISEGLDPKELTHLMNSYLGEMTEIIRHRRGTLDKYIGDAIMAFWGAPVDDPEHGRHALLAALEMQARMRTLGEEFKARGWPELKIGVGINSGTVTVGDMGSPVRKAYTVMGDAVNLASRLEGVTKEYGVGILVGEATRALADDVLFRELDRIRVKGKDKPVAIFEPVCLLEQCSAEQRAEVAAWEGVLAAYRAADWDAATAGLDGLRAGQPDSLLYSLYAERIAYLRQHPPGPDWDGVTTFTTK